MQTRIIYSIVLLILGMILAFLPLSQNRPLSAEPHKLLEKVVKDTSFYSVDQVAKALVNEDSTIILIDLRTPVEYREKCIPGSLNIPYGQLVNSDPQNYFTNSSMMYIFYSDDDLAANYAYVFARGFGYDNVSVMKGGLDAWDNIIMNSSFSGSRITARQNAVFEVRFKARRLFTEMNNLPDSLRKKYLLLRKVEKKKLDGGC